MSTAPNKGCAHPCLRPHRLSDVVDIDDDEQHMATSNDGEIPSAFANLPTVTPQRTREGAAPRMCPPKFHRPMPTLLPLAARRPTPHPRSNHSHPADPSLSRRDDSDGAGSTVSGSSSAPASRPQSQSQTQPQGDPPSSQALTPLPLVVMPDNSKLASTTRLLLQDTQAHMEKFAARMDAFGAHVEQSLREIEMCRTATEGASEKCIKEVVDVVYKCQSGFIKKLEATNDAVQKQGDAVHRLSTDFGTFVKLFETLNSTYALQATAIQDLQKQQVQLTQGLARLEPLLPQTENAVLTLGARLDGELQKSRDAAERQAAKLEDSSNSSSGAVLTRLGKLEDQLGDALTLLRSLATTPSSCSAQKTPTQNRRKRSEVDWHSPSPRAKRQRVYTSATHKQVPEYSDVFRREGESEPANFLSTTSSTPDHNRNSTRAHLGSPHKNKSRATGGRRATIAPALPVSRTNKLSKPSKRNVPLRSNLEKEVDALAEPFFAQSSKNTTNEATSIWSLRPRRAHTISSDSVDQDSVLPEVTQDSKAAVNNKRQLHHGKENDSHATSISDDGPCSHRKKANSKKNRRSTNVPDVTVSLRSPTPSPFVPPPPPQTQTQTQTDASQTQTLVPTLGSSGISRAATHIHTLGTSTTPTQKGSFLLTFDSSQATSQTFTQVASQVQTKAGTVGADTPVVGGSGAELNSTTSITYPSAVGADASGKLAKQENILAAALFPEVYGKQPMFDSYGRPKRFLSLHPEECDDDGSVIDLLDDMLEG